MQLKQFTDIAGYVQNIQLWQAMYRIFHVGKFDRLYPCSGQQVM